MEVVIVGNGAIALAAAYELTLRVPDCIITVLAPTARTGCASTAAAAMFNSFAELEKGTLSNQFEREKWLFNKNATPYWKSLLAKLEDESNSKIHHGFGTYLINNHVSDSLEDENFQAIIDGLDEFSEPYEFINPKDIPSYNPQSEGRASRCAFIPNEGFCNPIHLINAFESILRKNDRVNFVDDSCQKLVTSKDGLVSSVIASSGTEYCGDIFYLAPGATFSTIISNSDLKISFPRIFFGAGTTITIKSNKNTPKDCIRTPNRGLACGLYCAPRDQINTVVGATNSINPNPVDSPTTGSVYSLLKGAMEQINSNFYRAEVTSINFGWRPTSEDTLPLLGKTDIPNLLVATGTKRDGLHCSPLIAKCIVQQILGETTSHDLALFKPDRKPVKTLSRKEAVSSYISHVMNANYQHDFVPPKNRMVEQLEKMYRADIEELHEKVGAYEWGIPPELVDMYRYGHIK